MSEVVRRLERIEDKMDARIVTVDVYQAREAVFAAREATHAIEVRALEKRIEDLERTVGTAVKLIVASFLGLLVQAIVLIFTVISRAGVVH